ncbi:ABC transporter permease [Silvibacterium sp.]|uniref:ABC transporter permease n=1 Tax=Silvibacterium sp. TaxID=1964179 RepID=UPI0039E4C75E
MLLQDVKYALRQLRSSWGFAALAVITLALGIGANTAMFTVVESVLLRPLPYADSNRLISVGPTNEPGFGALSYLNFEDLRDQAHTLELAGGYSEDAAVIDIAGAGQSVTAPHLTPSILTMLGTQPLLGRTFSDAEGQHDGPQVVLLSEGLWRQSFHADPGILGRTITISGAPHTVIGVMPASFHFPENVGPDIDKGIWMPLQPSDEMFKDRGYNFFVMMAKMRPGVSAASASAEMHAIAMRIRQKNPKDAGSVDFKANGYQQLVTGDVRPVFLALLGALLLVLLIACANVANLLIARCLGRKQEFAVRAALGASRWRLIRQLLAEGMTLSLLGCALGTMLAWTALQSLNKLPQGTIPRADSIGMHWTVIVALAAVATATTLLSSLLPALLVARTDPQPALQASSRGLGSRSVSGKLSGWLVAGEVALSTVLLVGTGLLFHTLWNLQHASLGFETERVSRFTAMPSDAAGFSAMAVSSDLDHAPVSVSVTTYGPALERIRQVPGVADAAVATAPPLSNMDMSSSMKIVGHTELDTLHPEARVSAASEDYAQVLGTPLLRGRMISADDTESTLPVAVVNESLVKHYFGNLNPIGQQVDLGGKDTGMLKPLTIVGVLADQSAHGPSTEVQPFLLIPYRQVPTTSLFYQALLKTFVTFIVKTRGDMAIAPAMRPIFKEVAPGYALDNFQTMQEALDDSTFSQRLGLYLTASFAGLAVVMVIAGLYGVLAQLVSYRRREIGVRMALGATRQSIVQMILQQAGILIAFGLAGGLVLSGLAGRLVKSYLFGVKSLDPGTYAGVVLVLLLIGAVAALLPAHSASSIEPMEALRED